ncbi:pirin family protein [Sphaerotilus sp.]|uniref:pirin family protein n=1 Tax=Sphaerotilus sp. TaxID=2093942 RepID=UPI0034E22A43
MTELLRLSGRQSEVAAGLRVRRILPDLARRAVGPFVFFDHFGPVTLAPEVDSDVGGHPHTGLATVTYLFAGRQIHRDSLGTVQAIEPGAVNWMTAGRGIVHSERAHDDDRGHARPAHGLQLWVALPPELEETDPAFQHVPAKDIPVVELPEGGQAQVLVGQAWGVSSPVRAASPTLYLDVTLPPQAVLNLPALAPEMALYGPTTGLVVDGEPVGAGEMAVLPTGQGAAVQAGPAGARFVVIGGAPLAQPVRMWWNFVSTDRQRIADAARRWAEGGFAPIPGDTGRIAAPPWRG